MNENVRGLRDFTNNLIRLLNGCKTISMVISTSCVSISALKLGCSERPSESGKGFV